MARPKGTTRAKKPIEKYEYEKLMSFANRSKFIKQHRLRIKLKRVFTLLYITGCRISEIIDLSTSDLKMMCEHKEYSLANNTKTKKSRLIVFSDSQIELLKSIVPSVQIKLFDVSSSYLTIKTNNIIHKCLGELYSTHSFRAGYVTRLANTGANIKLIQEDIGHTNISTTIRYIKIKDDQKREAKEKLIW
jgi:integrase